MAPNGNRIVVYKGPGQVAVETVDYPKLEVPPDVASAMGMTRKADHGGHPAQRLDQHLRQRPAHGPRPHHRPGRPDPGPRDHRRGDREGLRRPVPRGGRHLLGAVQHRLRALSQLPRGRDRRLPQRQPGAGRLGVRLRRHGRLARRAGRVRDGALRRLQPAQVPRPRPGAGEDPRPDDALGHLPHRLPRLLQRRGDHRLDGLHRRRRSRRARRRLLGAPARRRRRDRRRPQQGAAGAGAVVRLRDRRRLGEHAAGGAARADPRDAGGRLRRRRRRVRGHRARPPGPGGPGDGAQLGHDRHQGRRPAGHPGPLRDRRPGRGRRRREGGHAQGAARPRLGQEPRVRDGPVPGAQVQPRA